MQRGFAPIFLLIGLFLIGAVVGGIYFYTNNSGKNVVTETQTPQSSQITTQVSSSSASVSLKLASASASLAPSVAPTPNNLKTYVDVTFPYSLQYPPNWEVSQTKDDYNVPTTRLRLAGQLTTEIHIGGPSIYSTSGAICANDSVSKGEMTILVANENIKAETCQTSQDFRMQFTLPESFTKRIAGFSESYTPVVTIRYTNNQEKEEILKIVSTIKLTN